MRLSGADQLITQLLEQDKIVYGGFSAGACVTGPTLRGFDLVDDPHIVPLGYPSEVIWESLGLLPFSILPHYHSEHAESKLIDVVMADMIENHRPFVALADGQVLICNGTGHTVVG